MYDQRIKEAIDKMTLMDDEFMIAVFDGNKEAVALVLNIILDRTDLEVTEVVAQREYKNLKMRSVRLDIVAKDASGKVYDIEIQRLSSGAGSRRARFHSSMLDTKLLKPKQDFSELVDTYVIFITESDVIGAGKPIYHIDRKIEETGGYFGDGAHIIYVNGEMTGSGTKLSRLMHDFKSRNADDMYYSTLAASVKFIKSSEGGQKNMSSVLDELKKEWEMDAIIKVAISLIKQSDHSFEEIAGFTGLPLEKIKELAEGVSA